MSPKRRVIVTYFIGLYRASLLQYEDLYDIGVTICY